MAKVKKKDKTKTKNEKKRSRLSQADVPAYSIEHALRVPFSIANNYGSDPSTPLEVASGMNVLPRSSQFRMLSGSAIAYGLTEGGAQSTEISLTDLGRRVTKPQKEGDDLAAKREAFLKPRVINEFMSKYNGSQIPKDTIAENVLNSFGVPEDKTANVLSLIIEGADSLGLTQDIKGKKFVNLSGIKPRDDVDEPIFNDDETEESVTPKDKADADNDVSTPDIDDQNENARLKNRKVFITHGKNKEFVEPIRKLLKFGELEAVVSVEKSTVSKPVPEKVLDDMRNCGAAIIHVDAEKKLIDGEAKEHVVLNPNVLIEIGAAMALYGRRFILLVKEGVSLPSNLQGLFQVRYSGNTLDGDATIRLLEAINNMKDETTPK